MCAIFKHNVQTLCTSTSQTQARTDMPQYRPLQSSRPLQLQTTAITQTTATTETTAITQTTAITRTTATTQTSFMFNQAVMQQVM